MSLTLNPGPLAGNGSRPDLDPATNYQIAGPAHRLLLHDFPRRVRAEFGGQVVLDTVRGKLLHETGLLPVLYFPLDDLNAELLEKTDHSTHCPFKGDAAYWSLRGGGRVAENAVWAYAQPREEASWLAGYAAAYWAAMDTWYDEDEQVQGHLRDPFHRVDVRASSRHVRVLFDGEVIAETRQPGLLSETGLPNRFYVPRDDVDGAFVEPSTTRTVCPYKGTASYWSVRVGDRVLTDAAWSYPEPLEAALKVGNYLCFDHEALTLEVDAEDQPS